MLAPLTNSQTVIARCRELALISDIPGVTFRTFLSPATRRCYETVGSWMKAAGMTVTIDAAGNLRGLRADVHPGNRVLYIGSHLDTVRDAGSFDGILGVILAVALVETFAAQSLPFDIEVIGFSEEEGARFPPFIGSRALAGSLNPETLVRTDSNGITIAQAIREFGLDPTAIPKLALNPSTAVAFLEFHIEQGPVLDNANESVAIVDAIVGQTRASVTFTGSANHAGTTPMNLRQDALTAAARWITAVEDIARSIPNLVATVGQLEVKPNISNVIPGKVAASLDIRHSDDLIRQQAFERCRQCAGDATWTGPITINTTHLNENLINKLQAACPTGTRHMVSGAGHDAMILAPHIPTVMLFLRSPGGISHHPSENVKEEDVALALDIGQRFIAQLTCQLT